jgi:hypothetical protein
MGASNGSGGGDGLKVPKSSLNAAVANSIGSAGHAGITASFQLTFHPDLKAGHDEGRGPNVPRANVSQAIRACFKRVQLIG